MKRQSLLAALIALVLCAASALAQTDYVIGSQDVLSITVFGDASMSGKFTVEQDGTFTFPQLGRIHAGGLTLREFEQSLVKQLADGYLRNPQVAVTIETYRSQRVLVLGEVRSPGEYQLASDMTLLAALARAGSVSPTAGDEVLIVRPARRPASAAPAGAATPDDEPEAEIIRVDLAALQAGNLSLNVILRDGDTVNVPRAQSVFVTGQVRSPGAYGVTKGTTVLQVLSLAGGLTDRGAAGRIRILRTIEGKATETRAAMTDVVEPGDTVVVPERFF